MFLFALVFATLAAHAAIINVPADQHTIQAGINAANPGDTVLVAPGTYYENIDFKGKAITVTSSGGAATTILDGSMGQNPAVTFRNNEGPKSILSGLTIQGGGYEGYPAPATTFNQAGIWISQGSPTISNNVITHNHCYSIESDESSPLIQNNEIDNTLDAKGQCSFAGGAAIWLSGSLSYYNGGSQETTLPARVVGNLIQNNTQSGREDAGGNGGPGVAVWGAYASIIGNTIRNNVTLGEGGAILAFNTDDVIIIGNLIYGNSAYGIGGIALEPPDETVGPFIGIIENNTIYGNTVQSTTSSPIGDAPASQMYLSGNLGQYVLVNNIIVGTVSGMPAVSCGTSYNYLSATPLVFDHNDIYAAQGTTIGGACADQTGTYGNISDNPAFSNPSGNDFTLRPGSPAIDTGNNSAPQMTATDLVGSPRIQDATGKGYPVVDMGAYEFSSSQDAPPTILTLTPSEYFYPRGFYYPNPQQPLTFTVVLTSAAGIPSGPVTIDVDGTAITTILVGASGTATFSLPTLTPGLHAFTSTYPGSGIFPPAVSVKFFLIIPPVATTLMLKSSPNPSIVGQTVTFTVATSAADGTVPTPITLTDTTTNIVLGTLAPNSAGVATFPISTLTPGFHTITASYAGTSTYSSASATVSQQVLAGYPTTTSVTSSLNPAAYGQSITFTATVGSTTSGSGSPTGSISFTDGANVLATQALTANGSSTASASFATSALRAGAHTITATYVPSGAFVSSAATMTQTITGLPTTTLLAPATPNPAYALQPITLSASVSTGTAAIATGSMNFFDGTTPLGTAPLDATGHAAFLTSTLTAGIHSLYAVYTGDTSFASSTSNSVSETIQLNPTSVSVSISPNPAAAFQRFALSIQVSSLTSVPLNSQTCLPSTCPGTITITGLPANAPSTAPFLALSGGTTLTGYAFAAGTYTFTVTFNGSSSFAASTSTTVTQVVVPAATTLTLAAANSAAALTSTWAALLSTETPNGTITFFDGATPFATAPFRANVLGNTVTVNTSTTTLAPGTHTITASYPGNINFLPVTSPPITVTINPADFTLTLPNPTLTVKSGQFAATTAVLNSLNGFADTLVINCPVLPAHLYCISTVGPNIQTPLAANGTVNVALTISTTPLPTAANATPTPFTLAALLSPFSLFAGILAFRRRTPLRLILFLLAILPAAISLTGCGVVTIPYTPPGAPGTYTIPITATGITTGITHTAQLTVVVTP